MAFAEHHDTLVKIKILADQGGNQLNHPIDAETGYCALHLATIHERQTLVDKLLEHGNIDVNKQDRQGCTSLLHAVLHDLDPIAAMLLRHGATLIPDNTGLTPWIAACLRGNETIVKLFLSVDGFNVNRTEPGNMSGLFVACSSGHAHIVSMLMKHGANVNVSAFLFHVSPLHTSVSMNHNDVVKLLLQHPQTKDILNKRTLGGATALYMAIEEENLLVTKMLLDSGANPCISVRGKTAFDKALETANAEIVFIVKQATIEPIRFHLLAWSRKRANLWNLDLDQDEKVVHIAAHVVHAWNDDLFHELETYLLPSWAV